MDDVRRRARFLSFFWFWIKDKEGDGYREGGKGRGKKTGMAREPTPARPLSILFSHVMNRWVRNKILYQVQYFNCMDLQSLCL